MQLEDSKYAKKENDLKVVKKAPNVSICNSSTSRLTVEEVN